MLWYDEQYDNKRSGEVVVDYYDKKNDYYIIYFPFNIKNYLENKSLLKINKMGWGRNKDDSVVAISKKWHFENGFGVVVYTKYKKTTRSNKLQKYINNVLKFLYYYYGVRAKSKTKFMFKKWE